MGTLEGNKVAFTESAKQTRGVGLSEEVWKAQKERSERTKALVRGLLKARRTPESILPGRRRNGSTFDELTPPNKRRPETLSRVNAAVGNLDRGDV